VPQVETAVRVKPRLRGVVHQYAFFAALAAGILLVLDASGPRERIAAAIFAGTVAAMFGASALYHVPTWSPRKRAWLCRLDHAMIYALIAGTYTPFGLLVLHGAWQTGVLTFVWAGAAAAILQKLIWVEAPKWLAATIGMALGWVGVIVFPQLYGTLGIAGAILLLGGGLMYTAGALVYALRRPDPLPETFGYHEVFHVLVAAAVVCQYSAIAFFVLGE
jgi:hemolysin III